MSISGHWSITIACGGINAIGEGWEILVFISTNFFSHQGLIDPLLVLPPYLSHEYVSACFPQSCPSRLLRPWRGGVTILEKWTQLRRPTAHNPPYQSAGIPHEHTSCFGSIFFRDKQKQFGPRRKSSQSPNCKCSTMF